MPDARAGVDAANRTFMTTFKDQNAAGMAALYTADGCILPTNTDVVSGAGDIQAFWQGIFDVGVKEGLLETVEVEGHGDTAIEVGRYTMKVEGGAVADKGKYPTRRLDCRECGTAGHCDLLFTIRTSRRAPDRQTPDRTHPRRPWWSEGEG
jgi:uncharacterized protein (TIGR02246 family)